MIEGPTAGGHNAPPRKENGKLKFNQRGEPLYGEKDIVNLDEIAGTGRPFWLAGSYASPAKIKEALALGAMGVQVGTIFALSNESGIRLDYKQKMRVKAFRGEFDVLTSDVASPTGFPFKVVQMEDTLSDPEVYGVRNRCCDIGQLVEAYQTRVGTVGFRCAAEPIQAYLQKIGKRLEDLSTDERNRVEKSVCLCNALGATVGVGQADKHGVEPAIITSGDNTDFIRMLMVDEYSGYSAADAVKYLMSVII